MSNPWEDFAPAKPAEEAAPWEEFKGTPPATPPSPLGDSSFTSRVGARATSPVSPEPAHLKSLGDLFKRRTADQPLKVEDMWQTLNPIELAKNVIPLADMAAGFPGQLAQWGAKNVFPLRVQLLNGVDQRTAQLMGQMLAQDIDKNILPAAPLRRVMEAFGKEDIYDKTAVAEVLSAVMSGGEQGAHAIEARTGGRVTAGTVMNLLDTMMIGLGAKGLQHVDAKLGLAAKPGAKVSPQARAEADATLDQLRAEMEPDAKPITDYKAAIEESVGIVPEKELAKRIAEKRKDVEAAIAEDPAWADQLAAIAEGPAREAEAAAARARSLVEEIPPTGERTRAPERIEAQERPVSLSSDSTGGLTAIGPDALTTATQKIRRLGPWALTAEEKIALRGITSKWNTPQILGAVATLGLGVTAGILAASDEEGVGAAAAGAALATFPRSRIGKTLGDSLTYLRNTLPPELLRELEVAATHPDTLERIDALRMAAYEAGAPKKTLAAFDDAARSLEQLRAVEREPVVYPGGESIWLMVPPGDTEKYTGAMGILGLAAITRLPETTPLRAIHERLPYTTKVLQAVAEKYPGHHTLKTEWIKQELGREGVGKFEKDLFAKIVEGRKEISAKELVGTVKAATGDFELRPRETQEYANYGLDNIGRTKIITGEEHPGLSVEEGAAPPSRTTIYQSPLDLGTANHFRDPNYFAHTRSFDEGGVRHVVEIQSDVAQKAASAGKGLNDAEITALKATGQAAQRRIDAIKTELESLQAEGQQLFDTLRKQGKDATSSEWTEFLTKREKLNRETSELRLRQQEAMLKIQAAFSARSVDLIRPMLKDWHKRLVREEVAGAAEARAETQNLIESKRRTIAERERELAALSVPESWTIPLKQKIEGLAYDLDVLAMDLRNGRVSEGTARQYMLRTEAELPPSARARWTEYWENNADETGAFLRPERGEEGAWGNAYASNFPKVFAEFLRKELGQSDTTWYKEDIKGYREDIARLDAPRIMRFATADTVAKVERWPQAVGRAAQLIRQRIDQLETDLRRVTSPNPPAYLRNTWGETAEGRVSRWEAELEQQKHLLDEVIAAEREYTGPRFEPHHQGIYDRYRSDIEGFLKKEYKARPYTDEHGHTWLEVDLPSPGPSGRPGPTRLLGAANQDLVTALGVLGLSSFAAYLSSPESKGENFLKALGVFTGMALLARSKDPGVAKMVKAASETLDTTFGNISAEIRATAPALLRRLTKHALLEFKNIYHSLKEVTPLVRQLRDIPETQRVALYTASLTGDVKGIVAALDAIGNPNVTAAWGKARAEIKRMGADLERLGLIRKTEIEYWPRIIADREGLLKHLGREVEDTFKVVRREADDELKADRGYGLTPFEELMLLNRHINKETQVSRPGFTRGRLIRTVTPELLKYYVPLEEAIPIYMTAAAKAAELTRFFGDDLVKGKKTGMVNITASIGNVVRRETAAKGLSVEEMRRLESLLRSRFGPGEHAGDPLTQAYKNLVYLSTLASLPSAVVQLGDPIMAAAVHNTLATIKSVAATVTRKPQKWSLADVGIVDHITEEFVHGTKTPMRIGGVRIPPTAAALNLGLKASLFSAVDTAGKNAIMNAAFEKYATRAQTEKGMARIRKEYGEYFGRDIDQLLLDLQARAKSPLTEELVFRELSDMQPVSKLEMPKAYLDNPNGRVMYTLRTFMVKQMNMVREKGFRQIARGEYREGAEFLTRFAIGAVMSGATAAMIQDFFYGKPFSQDWDDVFVNLTKTYGWSQYVIDEARKKGAIPAFGASLLPPYKMFQQALSTDPEAVQYLPLVGRIYYQREMGGARLSQEREAARKRAEEKAEMRRRLGLPPTKSAREKALEREELGTPIKQ